jgi:hypothetical protein
VEPETGERREHTMGTCYEENTAVQRAVGLLMGPILGLAYVVYLPCIAIVTTVIVLGRKVLGEALSVLRSSASFGWNPSEAYISGKRKRSRR